MRAVFTEEFDEIWCYDLRGNARMKGKLRKKESGNVFGSGSRTPIAITFLVKKIKIDLKRNCKVYYMNIGYYLSREEKLAIIYKARHIKGLNWQKMIPDKHHDWINKRNDDFSKYLLIGSKDAKAEKANAIFRSYSSGIKTNRDAWAYNPSVKELSNNMKIHIDYCKKHVEKAPQHSDPKSGKWDEEMSEKLRRTGVPVFDENKIRVAQYRPFFKRYLYFDKTFNLRQYLIPKFFPKIDSDNLVMCIPYKFTGEFSVFVTDVTPDLQLNFNGQCFPLYTYKDDEKQENITDITLKEYQNHYNNTNMIKKDIFYYIYGLLHHQSYRSKCINNLIREFPRIPMAPDFWAYNKAGKKLADLHTSFDSCNRYDLGIPKYIPKQFEKLSFPKKKITVTAGNGKKKKIDAYDETKVKIDGTLAFDNIPEISYVVNGRTPLGWVINQYKVSVDKGKNNTGSGIRKDPCIGIDVVAVIERAVYVGIESDKIIKSLPKEFESKD